MRISRTAVLATLAVLLGQIHAEGPAHAAAQGAIAPVLEDGVRWRTDLSLAAIEAKRDKRPLLVVFR